jgi:hypothetical protein
MKKIIKILLFVIIKLLILTPLLIIEFFIENKKNWLIYKILSKITKGLGNVCCRLNIEKMF